jgi:hypothetical protein
MIQSDRMSRFVVLAAVLALMGGAFPMSDPQSPDARRLASYIPVAAGPWLSEADQVYDAEGIFEYIDGAGEVYRSYNMRLLVARRFHKDGKPDIVVDAFDMGSSEDAFGVFTHDLDGESASIGQGSVYKAGLLSFWKDRYFLSVYAEEETAETKALVLDLGRRIAAAIPGTGGEPGLLKVLPSEGFDRRGVRFFHVHSVLNYHYFVAEENILLLDRTTDAVLAGYDGEGGGAIRLLAVAYADGPAASRALASFSRAYMPDAGDGMTVRTENGKWTAARAGAEILAVVFDAPTEQRARGLLESVLSLAGARIAGPAL